MQYKRQFFVPLPKVEILELHFLKKDTSKAFDDRQTFVGNNIFPTVENAVGPYIASSIVGMIVESEDKVNFVKLLTDATYFSKTVGDAYYQFLDE